MRAGLSALVGLTWQGAIAAAHAARFPDDAGVLNVRAFGARGDGRHDDTAAVLAAIGAAGENTGAAFWRTRIIYLPTGTYLVSSTLARRYSDGHFASGTALVGDGESATVIRLADHADGFDDPGRPRGVVMTTSKLLDGTPTSGGKDYLGKGEGNDAYENFVENLTIDVGHGNPGAVGIDYLGNNIGAIRDVRVTASEGSGATGIAMWRKWPGPTLVQRVTVDGFDTGIAVANTEYGVTLDNVHLTGQHRVGLADDENAISASRLVVDGAPTPIANSSAKGLIVLDHSTLRGGLAAIRNRGTIVGLDLRPDDPASAPLTGVLAGGRWEAKIPPFAAALADPPAPPDDPPSRWANVRRLAAPGPDPLDVTDGLRKAMASGAATIYLPYGRYAIRDGIDVPPTVRRIVGFNASISVSPARDPAFSRDAGELRVAKAGKPLWIEGIVFDQTDIGGQLAVQVTAPRTVVLRDLVTAGATLLDRTAAGGPVFIEDTCCGPLRISGRAPVYARQLDMEWGTPRLLDDGAPLTVLGIKTEGDGTAIEGRGQAAIGVLGGLLYIVRDADPSIPAFRMTDATRLFASFVEESFRAASRYTIYVAGSQTTPVIDFPARGYGRLVPWLGVGSAGR